MADGISLSQDELNNVLSNIRKDNDEHEKAPVSLGISLSQSELEKLFGGSSSAKSSEKETAASSAETTLSPDATRAAKIEERKRRAAELFAQANASSPKRITAVYGTATKRGKEIDALHEGDWITLDRIAPEYVDILVDGKLFARGIPTYKKDQYAAVQIVHLVKA